MKNLHRSGFPISPAGFSRRELIVTIACLALLSLLALAWRTKSRDLPSRKVCARNLRQLVVGFNSYEMDTGRFPAAARIGVATNDDWIFWQTERLLKDSVIAGHMSNFPDSLRCPADAKFSFRGYPYSYSMNVNFERASTRRVPNPAMLLLLYEEEAPNDGAFLSGAATDRLSARHVQRSNAGFLDGHVESITERAATDPTQSRGP